MQNTQSKPGLPPDYELLVATPASIRWLTLVLIAIQLAGLAYMLTAVLASSRPLLYLALAVILLLFVHFVRNTLDVNNWVSGVIARDGIYLPDKQTGALVLMPWRAIGSIETGRAGLMVHGLRLQLLDAELAGQLANTMTDSKGHRLVRLPTQMMNRATLLQRIEAIRRQ
jgi:hypothetical protein